MNVPLLQLSSMGYVKTSLSAAFNFTGTTGTAVNAVPVATTLQMASFACISDIGPLAEFCCSAAA